MALEVASEKLQDAEMAGYAWFAPTFGGDPGIGVKIGVKTGACALDFCSSNCELLLKCKTKVGKNRFSKFFLDTSCVMG